MVPTEGMRKLVLQSHADYPQAGSAGPGTKQSIAAGLNILRVMGEDRKGGGNPGYSLLGDHVCDGVGIGRVQCFNCMGNSVDARCDGELYRKGQGEVNIVDDNLW